MYNSVKVEFSERINQERDLKGEKGAYLDMTKQVKMESESFCLRTSPPLPLPRFWVRKMVSESITNKEIKKFWRQKQINEEEHFLAAIKAAAHVRARNLSEEEYKRFEESLDVEELEIMSSADNIRSNEVGVGIKDWWTKSKYAYLNQPALGSTDSLKRRRSSYKPNCFPLKPSVPLYPTSLDIF